MTLLIWIFIVLYACIWSLMVVVDTRGSSGEERDPVWERALDRTLIVSGLVGMLLYQTQPEIAWLPSAWKVVVVASVVCHLGLLAKTAYALFGPNGTYDQHERWAVWGGAAIAAFMVVPSIAINALYAFGREA